MNGQERFNSKIRELRWLILGPHRRPSYTQVRPNRKTGDLT